jgi:hypothetical protein
MMMLFTGISTNQKLITFKGEILEIASLPFIASLQNWRLGNEQGKPVHLRPNSILPGRRYHSER